MPWTKKTAAATCAAVTLADAALGSGMCSTPTAASCCTALVSSLGGSQIFYPNSTSYTTHMSTYWSVSAALDPWCIALPFTSSDVSAIVSTLAANNCPFGVRGGGHGSFDGSNSVADGVTVDFSSMNSTTYSEDDGLVGIGPGAHWQSVYDTLAPRGVVVTGGRAGTVGVGGFVAGGGNSFHSASHGMACDQVRNFEVVLADGSVVDANADENPDLWAAMKGGSANFGLITRFDMNAISFLDPSSPDIWGGNYLYNLSAGDAVIDALVDFTDGVQDDLNSSAIVYWAYLPALGGMILNAAVENTLGAVSPPAFDGFKNISGLTTDTTTVAPMSNVTLELGSGQPSGFRNVWLTSSFENNAEIMRYAVEQYYTLAETLEGVLSDESEFNLLCMFQPITKSIADRGVEMGGNVMGLDYYTQDSNGIMFLLTLALNGEDQEDLARPYLSAYLDDLDAKAQEMGVGWDWKYLNYADRTQDPLATYGEDAIAKMRAASEQYDPDGVFQTLRSTGFKIPQ
ncbi:FAD binding domain-containing protein [Zalerion maritima]|uniref:FAD binding domain-containing protein n=1 Tax=Zalerion maritima TaxID=339359 RepID=A0AAD5WQT6_9PEZI|nr:FAD binding domain-containing protein [Zalerion maritima]